MGTDVEGLRSAVRSGGSNCARSAEAFAPHGAMAGARPGLLIGQVWQASYTSAARDHRLATDAGLIPAFPRQWIRAIARFARTSLTRHLRLCLVAPSESPGGEQSVQASQLRQGLVATGAVRVTLVSTDRALPAWLRPVGGVRVLRTMVQLAWFVPPLARAMRATDVTHVFVAEHRSFALTAGAAVILGRLLRKPVIVHYGSSEALDHLRRQPVVVRWVVRRAQQLVVPSLYLAGIFECRGYAPARIPNTVELSRFPGRPRAAPFLRFLCAGSFEPFYDIATAIRAFGLIAAGEPRAALTLVGGGSQAGALRRLVRELGLEGRVRFVGPVPHGEIAQFYRMADVYFNPALIDNQPLGVLEAMAAGLYVVSTDVGDMRDLLSDGRAGALVAARSPGAMAAAARCVIHDERRFDAAAEAARAVLVEHAPTQVARRWIACYREVRMARDAADASPQRPWARLLRVRQELAKRVEALTRRRRWESVRDTLKLLRPDVRGVLRRQHIPPEDALRASFARRAAARYPSRHLDRRDPDAAPDRHAIVDEAGRLCAGAWRLFGSELAGFAAAPDWRAHPLSGEATPAVHWSRISYLHGECGGDVKFIWELNRHGELVRLAQAYYLTRSERYAARLRELLTSWLRQNPPGLGVNWTSSLEVAIRSIAWCWIWHLTKTSQIWNGPLFAEFLWQLWHHARHVERYDSTHHSPNTHLTGEALGLLYVGTLFPEVRRARRWRERGLAVLLAELEHQVLGDGMHCERSSCYQRYTLEICLHLWLLGVGGRGPHRGRVRGVLHRLLVASSRLCRPDGSWPVLGDEDGGRLLRLGTAEPIDQRPLVLAGTAALRHGSSLDLTPERVRSEAWWLLGEAAWTWGRAAVPAPGAAPGRAASLPRAGYHVGRDDGGGDRWYCLVTGGSPRPGFAGHAHADLGHVEIARGAQRLVSDPGCSTYTADRALRDWFRSEGAHACVSVEGLPLAEPGGPFGWRRLPPPARAASWDAGAVWLCEVIYVRGDGADAVHHRRQVVLVRGQGVVVCDWLTGRGARRLVWQWPLPVGPDAVVLRNGGAALDGVAIQWFGVGRSTWPIAEVAPHPFAPTYGRLSAGSLLAVRCSAELPAALVTSFGATSDLGRCLAVAEHRILVTLPLPAGTHEVEFRAFDRPVARRAVSHAASLSPPWPLSPV